LLLLGEAEDGDEDEDCDSSLVEVESKLDSLASDEEESISLDEDISLL
jgi:hypothetical protein